MFNLEQTMARHVYSFCGDPVSMLAFSAIHPIINFDWRSIMTIKTLLISSAAILVILAIKIIVMLVLLTGYKSAKML